MADLNTYTLYDHIELSGVMSEAVDFKPQLLNHFGSRINTDEDTINLDKIVTDARIAIYVDRKLPAKTATERGYSTVSFPFPYTKQKKSVVNNGLRKRKAGQPFNVNNSPLAAYNEALIMTGTDFLNRHNRLKELAAAQLLTFGTYTATSERYPEPVVIDLGRKAALSADYTTLNRNGGVGKGAWDATGGTATVSPMADFEEWFDQCQEPIQTVYMSNKSWALLKADQAFKDSIDMNIRNLTSANYELFPQQGTVNGLKYRGTMTSNGTNIFTYTGTYEDIDGVTKAYLPDGYVIGIPASEHGVIAHGAIEHGAAGYQAYEEFWNNWFEDEFGVPYIQMQSAPLLLHTKINSTFGIKVHS